MKNNSKIKSLDSLLLMFYIIGIYTFPFKVLFIELLFIVFNLKSLKTIKINFYLIWNICFLIICFTSIIYSISPKDSLINAIQILKMFLVGNILIKKIKIKQELEKFLKYFICGGIALIIRLLFIFPVQELGVRRLNIPGIFNANDIGMKLGISSIFLLYFIFFKNKKNFINFLILSLFSAFIFFTGSRTAFFFLIFGFSGTIIFSFKNKFKLIIITISIVIVLYLFWDKIIENKLFYQLLGKRIESVLNIFQKKGKMDNSSLIRLNMMKIGIELWMNKPLFGYGLEGYRFVSGWGTYSHNTYIELLVNTGLIGFIVYFYFYICLFFKFFLKFLKKIKQPLDICFCLVLVILTISNMAIVSFRDRYFSIVLVMCFVSLNLKKKDRF